MANLCLFGDSITWGSWDLANGGWAGRLIADGASRFAQDPRPFNPHVNVFNCGVPGDTVADLLHRFNAEAAARSPDAIVLAIGINDVLRADRGSADIDEFTMQYEKLVSRALAITPDVVLVTPTNLGEAVPWHDDRNTDIVKVKARIEDCAHAHGLPLVDVFGLMTPTDLPDDGLHPNASGHQKLFDVIAPVVWSLPSLHLNG